jgi:hypothetical protein
MPGKPPLNQITVEQWAISLLQALGNPGGGTDRTRAFVVGWATAEGGATHNNCQYNFLNTTQPYGGSTQCSSVQGIPVQSYNSVDDSIAATAMTIKNGLYPSLSRALETSDDTALGMTGQPISPGVAGDLTVWATGKRTPIDTHYINNILSAAANGDNAVKTVPVGNPDQQQAQGIANQLGNTSLNLPVIAKGAIGFIMILAGLALLIKAITPPQVTQAVGAATKLLA